MIENGAPDQAHPLVRALDLAAADLAEKRRVGELLARAHDAVRAARAERERLRDVLTEAELRRARLESLSPARILASLCGSRQRQLDRRHADVDLAASAVAQAEADIRRRRSEVDELTKSGRALEGAEPAYERALHAVAASGHDTVGPAPDHVGRARAVLDCRREVHEIEEAMVTGRSARQSLQAVLESLRSAGAWSDWDTFGGGQVMASTMKHERLDEARQLLDLADEAVRRFRRALADREGQGLEAAQLDAGATRSVDIWFDNVVMDVLVGHRITQCQQSVAASLHGVEQALSALTSRHAQLVAGAGRFAGC